MKKILFTLIGTLGLVLVSCGIAQKRSEVGGVPKSEPAKLVKNGPNTIKDKDSSQAGNSENGSIPQPQKDNTNGLSETIPAKESEKPITQYDSEKLDKEVRELALKLGEDPKTFRMLIRTGEDGTKIYRMIGMHVIVNPQGDEVFLPDEL